MLSRSSSNAGERLRRAKSTSSAHTAASGHQRQRTNNDPGASRQHAEAAALEAYERARQHGELAALTGRPQLTRRRSQIAAKSEGSHFEEARRRSQIHRANSVRPRTSLSSLASQRQPAPSEPRQEVSTEERVITRKRSVIPPMPSVDNLHREHLSSLSIQQSRPSVYTEGSPAPRYSECLKERNSALEALTSGTEATDSYNFAPSKPAEGSYEAPTHTPPRPARPRLINAQQSGETNRIATEKQFEQNAQKRLRERKSFFGSFQKRRATGNGFDTSLPPFNYASDGDAAPIPHSPALTTSGVRTQKSRHFSSSIKGRLKQVFRKTSKSSGGLPPQQVPATEHRFTVKDYDVSEETNDSFVDTGDPFMTVAAEHPGLAPPAPDNRPSSKASTTVKDSARSRVTSWTNSSLAAVSSIRTSNGPFVNDSGATALHGSDSSHALRKRSSFFGNHVRNKLRRASKAELKSSEESLGLYSALQNRIRSSRSSEPVRQPPASPLLEPVSLPTTGALRSLPSQQRKSASLPSTKQRLLSTIRAITPASYKVDVPSPVHEVRSSPPSPDLDDTVIHHAGFNSPEESPSGGLQRRSAIKAPPISPNALARRMERAQSRWQSPLDGESPFASQTSENPHEFTSVDHSMTQSTPTHGLPSHAKVGDVTRLNVVSPSVYSRATDGASPRPLSPEVEDGTMITITGREVRTYSISPAKPPRTAHHRGYGSGAWRKWLSDEMNSSLGNNEQQFQFPNAFYGPTNMHHTGSIRSGHKRSMPSIAADLRPRSISPLSDDGKEDTRRPRSRASSIVSAMEGRYHTTAPGRKHSQHSVVAASSSRPASPEERILHSVAVNPRSGIECSWHAATAVRPGAMRRPSINPIYELEANGRCQSAMESVRPKEPLLAELEGDAPKVGRFSLHTGNSPILRVAQAVNRPRSAYELRAQFKNSISGKARPIEVRRKPAENTTPTQHESKNRNADISMIDDSTILNISAGPYAAQPQRPSSANHENIRPSSTHVENRPPLPALSSSEWLATGSVKKRPEVRNGSLASVMAKPSISRRAAKNDAKRSPGQRMVTNWLDERKSRESLPESKEPTPAFV